MRALIVAVLPFVLAPGSLVADPLNAADRELLLERLDQIDQAVAERVDARYRAAIKDYREALLSEDAVMDFYLKCVEKVDFTDKGKRPAEFRAWKKRQDENLDQAAMRRALVHQLRWLVLTLKAASENADIAQVTTDGMSAIDAVFADKPALTSQRGVLGQSVLGTVFARAYSIEGVETDKWPANPLDVGSFFQNMVFPKYRMAGDFKNLRAAWIKRIQMSMEMTEPEPSENNLRNAAERLLTRRQENFQENQLPNLQWEMEKDLFSCGDQRQAATNMVDHLTKHATHPSIRDWTDELRALLQGQAAPTQPAEPASASRGTAP